MRDHNSIIMAQKPSLIFQKAKEWKEEILRVAGVISQSVPVILALKNSDFGYLREVFKKEKVVNLLATVKPRTLQKCKQLLILNSHRRSTAIIMGYMLSLRNCVGV